MSAGVAPLLGPETREAIAALTGAMVSLRPLLHALSPPVRVDCGASAAPDASPADCIGAAELLGRMALRLGVPAPVPLSGAAAAELGIFERLVSGQLGLESLLAPACRAPRAALHEVDEIVDQAVRDGFDHHYPPIPVTSFDGTPLRAYAAGRPSGSAVVIALPCGMPVGLCERWIRFLGDEHFVLTLETRGLFGGAAPDGCALDVEAQAGDLLAVMDHFGVARAHLLGLCGGAVVSLAAAAAHPERVSSLSLWHGDFGLGSDAPSTSHQQNMREFLGLGAGGPESATAVHAVLCRTMLGGDLPDRPHLVLYPYANPDILLRYCRLNGSIMAADVRPLLHRVTHPVLVVTSEDDITSHPAGSRWVAEHLPNTVLHVAPHGDHLSLFTADPVLLRLASDFISRTSVG